MSTRYVIRARIQHDNEFLVRCLLALYEQQELDEQEARHTQHQNGMGFNKSDSNVLSEYAEAVKSGYRLSEPQLQDARRKLTKYSNQLLSLLREEDQ